MKRDRDPLGWIAMLACIGVTAHGEWSLAVACGYVPAVAAGLPIAIDAYAIRAMRAGREILAPVLLMIATNAAAHLLQGGMLTVAPWLVVLVSAIAPVVLWRVHALRRAQAELTEVPAEPLSEPSSAPAEPITIERTRTAVATVQEPVDAVPTDNVLGPFVPFAELAAGTGGTGTGTGPDLLGDHFASIGKVIGERPAEPTPEPSTAPVPPPVPPTGTGAADLVSEDTANTTFNARVDRVRNWLETEPELSGGDVGTRLGVSDGYGRRLLRAAREDT
ncbi:hypothetical protein [Streptomyces parvulus]|uniref:hypothetical protein n=1 Tax=Streptomyces parvulus TaxID=146923 RepID=UPI003EC12EEC